MGRIGPIPLNNATRSRQIKGVTICQRIGNYRLEALDRQIQLRKEVQRMYFAQVRPDIPVSLAPISTVLSPTHHHLVPSFQAGRSIGQVSAFNWGHRCTTAIFHINPVMSLNWLSTIP